MGTRPKIVQAARWLLAAAFLSAPFLLMPRVLLLPGGVDVVSLPSALGRGLVGAVEAVVPDGHHSRPRTTRIASRPGTAPGAGRGRAAGPTPTARRLVRVVTPACATCVVRQNLAAGTISATVGRSTTGGSRAAFAVLDVGAPAQGAVRVHDRVGLGAGQVPRRDVTVLRVTDAGGHVVYELRIQGGSRLLRFHSPAGGLTADAIDVSTGRTVPDDGVSKLDVLVDTRSDRSVVVLVDGTVALTLTGLAGGSAQQAEHVAVGIVGTAAGEQGLTVAHDDLTVAIQPAAGGAAVVVTPGALPTAPQSPAPAAPQPPPPPAPPTGLTAPQVAGTPVEGSELTADPGTWQDAGSIRIRWSRCTADGSGCRPIRRASGSSYTLGAADVGSAIRAVVAATNDGGTTTVASAALGPVSSATPIVVAAPALSGTSMQGQTLTATPGTWRWTTGPATFAWSRCDASGSGCAPIAGATGATYLLGEDDIGSTIRVTATVPGARGPSSASATTAVVVPAPPVSLAAPGIAGAAIVGRTLTADPGAWSRPTPTLTYGWLRCAKDGSSCVAIDGAAGPTYLTTADDAGATIEVAVTGTNISGTATAVSPATAPILGPAKNLAQPTIS
ncbi:MAG TPA: hypothetical protein VHC45_05370, partial [Gaiellaceae bacterium]|nr:hypothetical protein [Gaiellaceae bacterium]